ncbi:MAG: diacylglycerol kinase family protein [Thermoleophilia bacterium]
MGDAGGPVVLLVNAGATRVSGEVVREAERALRPAGLAAVLSPRGVGAAREALERAVADGARTVATLGGDGTVALAAGVVAGTGTGLLPLPGGSTNVFARGLGWPADPLRAARSAGRALEVPGRGLRLGEVVADGRASIAIVNTGIGVDAGAADWVERHPRAKRRLRQGAFAIAVTGPGVRELLAAPALLHAPDADPVPVHALIAAWGRPYAYVGPRPIDLLPQAAWDGRMAWIALTARSPLRAAGMLAAALRHREGPVSLAGSIGGLTTGGIVLESERGVLAQADGDPLGRVHRLELRPGPELLARVPA